MPPTDDNHWERWRGETNSDVRELREDVRSLWDFKDQASREIAILKTQVVIFSAIAAAIGATIGGGIVQAIMK